MKINKTLIYRILLIVSISLNIILALYVLNNSSDQKEEYFGLRERADSLLLIESYQESATLFEEIYEQYPDKINIRITQSLIAQYTRDKEQLESLDHEIIEYQTLINTLKEENSFSQKQFQKILIAYDIHLKENLKSSNLDSVFLAIKSMEIEELKELLDLSTTSKDILDLETLDGISYKYMGDVVDGKANGFGYAIFAQKGFYEGQWNNNKRNGQGMYQWQNGDKFEGEYFDDKRQGYGTYYFNSGEIYIGEWKDDLRHGQGKMINKKNKIVYDGIWERDETLSKY